MFTGRFLRYSISLPSGRIHAAWVPVVFAQVRMPASRKMAAISRVTLVLPRVPLTMMRIGIALRFLRWRLFSTTPASSRIAVPARMRFTAL